MINFFLDFDFLGPTPYLYIKKNQRFKTIIGLFLSMICFFFIGLLCILLFYNYIENKEIHINEYFEKKGNFSFTLYNDSVRFKILNNYDISVSKRIIEINALYFNFANDNKITKLNTSTCNLNDIQNLISDNGLNNEDYTCLSKNNVELTISKEGNYSSFIIFYVSKCTNSTENHNHCLPIEYINSYLLKNEIKILTIMNNYIIKNYENIPFILSPYIKKIDIINGFFYNYNFNYKKLLYKKDKGFLIPRYTKKDIQILDILNNDFQIYPEYYQTYYPNSLMSIKIDINKDYIHIIEMTFIKFSDYISNIIGISFIIYKLFFFINYIFVKGVMFTEYMDISNVIESQKNISKYMKKSDLNDKKYSNLSQSHSINQSLNNSNLFLNIPITKSDKDFSNILKVEIEEKEHITSKKIITLWNSFLYSIKYLNQNNKKIKYILSCEEITKKLINTESIIKKSYQVDLLIQNSKNEISSSEVIKSNSEIKIPFPKTQLQISKKFQSKKDILEINNSKNITTIIREEDEN